MRSPRAPLFLARRAYRRRRLTDAARLLPLVGLFLFLLPIFWRPAETPGADTASGGIYVFAVWVLLIAAAACLAAWLGPDEPPPGTGSEDGGTAP